MCLDLHYPTHLHGVRRNTMIVPLVATYMWKYKCVQQEDTCCILLGIVRCLLLFLLLIILWYFGPFSGNGFPYHLPPTFSSPCCRLPVPYVDQIYGISHNSILPPTSRLSPDPVLRNPPPIGSLCIIDIKLSLYGLASV